MLYERKVKKPLVKIQKVNIQHSVRHNPIALTTTRMVNADEVDSYVKKGYYVVK